MVSEEIKGRVSKKVCLSCSREFTGVVNVCPHDGTVLIPLAQDPLIGSRLAERYHIISLIGQGGMGNVYKARHELMERDVAIKMLKADLISDSQSVKRFQQEARAACRLKHPNVITLFDFGVSPNGQPYLVMDYLVGISLADVIKKDGHVGTDRTVKITTQACRALEHAHRNGVIHRDLKPGNIMLIETDETKDFVKVVDFGVAKLIGSVEDSESQRLTQTGEVCGSPVYMSPEQCMGLRLGPPSDIYSMGVVLYETLTGRLPLLGKTMVDTMQKHISETPPPFSGVRPDLYIPERLERVVFRALRKEPAERHQSMAELEQELELAIPRPTKSMSLRTTSPALEAFKVPVRQPAKPRWKLFLIAAAACLLAVGGMLSWINFNKGRTAPTTPSTAVPTTGGECNTARPGATVGNGKASPEQAELKSKAPSGKAANKTLVHPGTAALHPAKHTLHEPAEVAPVKKTAQRIPAAKRPKSVAQHANTSKTTDRRTAEPDPFADLARGKSFKTD